MDRFQSYQRVSEEREEKAIELAETMFSLSDPTRVLILSLLLEHQKKMIDPRTTQDTLCVQDLADCVGLAQPTISHHLAILRRSHLVGKKNLGLEAYYYPKEAAIKSIANQILALVAQQSSDLSFIDLLNSPENFPELIDTLIASIDRSTLLSFVDMLLEKIG